VAKRDIESIGDVLAALSQQGSVATGLRHALIWQRWEAIAGAELAGVGSPLGVRDGVLYVEAVSPVWMNRFAYAKHGMLDRIAEVLGSDEIADLFIRLKFDD
jgi:predicted nucleic acid-binding Zn ribbon protein